MTNTPRSVLRNAFASTGSQLLNLTVSLASSVYVARVLGTSQFGMLNWALGLSMIVSPLATGGVDNLLVREIARKKENLPEHLASALSIKAVFSTLCYLGIIAYIHIRGCSGLQLAVGYILCATVVSEAFVFGTQAVLVALERQDITAIISVAVNAIRVAAVIALVKLGFNVVAVAWLAVGASVASLVAQLLVIRRFSNAPWRPSLSVMKCQVRGGGSYIASTMFNGVFNRIDFVMLEYYRGVAAVGIYGAAYRIIEIVTTIAYNSSLAVFPIVSKRVDASKEGYARALVKSTKYLTMFGIPLCAAIFLLSQQLIVGLYGDKYAASSACLAILIWSRILVFTVLPGQQGVQARNAQLLLAPAAVMRMVLNIALNIVLIPRYGYIGASIAMVCTEPIYYVGMYLFAFRGPERFNPLTLLARPVAATLVMAGVVLLLRPVSAVLAGFASVPAYVLTLLAIGGLDAEDKRQLYKIIGRGKETHA